MKNNTDIVLLLVSLAECEPLTDVEQDRLRRVVQANAMEIGAVRGGLMGAGHHHLAADVGLLVERFGKP